MPTNEQPVRSGLRLSDPVLLVAIALLATLTICLILPSERTVRLSGMVLQLMGIATVIIGIEKTRASFGHDPVLVKWYWAVRRSLSWRKPVIVSVTGVAAGASSAHAVAGTSVDSTESQTLEDRVARLETQHQKLQATVTQYGRRFDAEVSRLDRAVDLERQARLQEDEALLQRFEETSTGGFRLTFGGTVLLTVGAILGTAAPEIWPWLPGCFLRPESAHLPVSLD